MALSSIHDVANHGHGNSNGNEQTSGCNIERNTEGDKVCEAND